MFSIKNETINDHFFNKMGSTWLLDSLFFYVSSPIAFIGFLLNLLSFAILCKIKIKSTKLYKYLRVYSINSSFICFILMFGFVGLSPRLFPFFNHYLSKFYRCKLIGFIFTTIYCFGNVLDIIIALDRLSIFIKKLDKNFNHARPYYICLISFFICFLVNFPVLLSYKILNDEEFLNSDSLTYCGQTAFAVSKLGMTINMIILLIRDLLTLIVEILINCLAICFYSRFSTSQVQNHKSSSSDYENNEANYKQRVKDERGKRLLLMTINLCTLSIISHIIVCITFVSSFLLIKNNKILYNILVFFTLFSINIKHSFNIFIFYFFNTNFKKSFRNRLLSMG
jgi:hypothetical protein